MPGPLKNARQEKFAKELAKGKSQLDAYAAAGYRPNDGHAARLAGNGRVAARVDELKGRAAEKAVITAADIAKQLEDDRKFAIECRSPSAAVSVTLGKAKVLGLVPERHELTGRNGGPIEYRNLDEDEIDARLRALSEQHAEPDRPLAH